MKIYKGKNQKAVKVLSSFSKPSSSTASFTFHRTKPLKVQNFHHVFEVKALVFFSILFKKHSTMEQNLLISFYNSLALDCIRLFQLFFSIFRKEIFVNLWKESKRRWDIADLKKLTDFHVHLNEWLLSVLLLLLLIKKETQKQKIT